MTREEAIKLLSAELKERSEGYYSYIQHYGHKDKAEEDYLDSLHMAIAALRKQEAQNKGCGWCKLFAVVPLRGFTEHGCQSITVKFCPQCGRRLEAQDG